MDKSNAIAALTANGLTKMDGVRSDTYAYYEGGKFTFYTLGNERFYAEGEISHLPMVMGYSTDEVRKAVWEMAVDDDEIVERVVEQLKLNRKESGK